MIKTFITSGYDDKAILGFLEATALATFVPISRALPGFLGTFLATVFDTFTLFLLRFLKKSPKHSAINVSSETVIDSFSITNWTIAN